MLVANKIQNRIDDQKRLFYKIVYYSSILSLVFALVGMYVLNIRIRIPIIFITFSCLNLLNLFAFRKHGQLATAAAITAGLGLLGTSLVSVFSGGINSPFIFVLATIVLGGYISARIFGTVYMIFVTLAIMAIYAISESDFEGFVNEVPEKSKDFFSLISFLFTMYILGGVFGRDLLKSHQKLKTSKAEIEKGIDEKEILLREVHHRVKNNLQTVSSLLNLQVKNSTNEKIKNLVMSSQNRVNSMAIIHEMLYVRDNLSRIEFKSYVSELLEYLLKSDGNRSKDILINIDIPDTHLGIDTAIPLGLLINEAVTNSLKYGFRENNKGRIDISLQNEENSNTYILNICDNGVGFSNEIDFRNTKSLGLKLIHNLARQLRGSVKRDLSAKGTHYSITFQDVGLPNVSKARLNG